MDGYRRALLVLIAAFMIPGVQSVCTQLTAKTTWGTFTSPNYPNIYDNNLSHCWIITAYYKSDQVLLQFLNFDVEPGPDCPYDYLEIRDGGSRYSPLIGKYCGTGYMSDVTSSGNQIYVYFKTDESIRRPGFAIQYKDTDSWIRPAETSSDSGLSTTWIIVLSSIACIVGLIGVTVGTALYCLGRSRRNRTRTLTQSRPPSYSFTMANTQTPVPTAPSLGSDQQPPSSYGLSQPNFDPLPSYGDAVKDDSVCDGAAMDNLGYMHEDDHNELVN